MTRFLFLSLAGWLFGCSPSHPLFTSASADVTCLQKFIPEFKSQWYGASLDITGNHLSGLFLFKKLNDQSQRIVFTNEAGVTFFDIGFNRDGDFKVYQAMKKINRNSVMETLRKDFELLLMEKARLFKPSAYSSDEGLRFAFETRKETSYIVTNTDCSRMIRLERVGKKKAAEIVFWGTGTVPDSISIQHFNFPMAIKLKKLNR